MGKKEEKVLELQEILFWHQLNKQLIEFKDGGKPIDDNHHKYLRNFSLKSRLFSKITENPVIDYSAQIN